MSDTPKTDALFQAMEDAKLTDLQAFAQLRTAMERMERESGSARVVEMHDWDDGAYGVEPPASPPVVSCQPVNVAFAREVADALRYGATCPVSAPGGDLAKDMLEGAAMIDSLLRQLDSAPKKRHHDPGNLVEDNILPDDASEVKLP